MAKIYAPNKQYCGVSASVSFVNGVGETDDPNLIEWFEDHGYKVEGVTEKEPEVEETDIDKMTVAQLKKHAADHLIDLGEATKKEDILAKIKDAQPDPSAE